MFFCGGFCSRHKRHRKIALKKMSLRSGAKRSGALKKRSGAERSDKPKPRGGRSEAERSGGRRRAERSEARPERSEAERGERWGAVGGVLYINGIMCKSLVIQRFAHNEVAVYVKYSEAKRSGKPTAAGAMRRAKHAALGGRAGSEHDRSGAEGVPYAEGGGRRAKSSGAKRSAWSSEARRGGRSEVQCLEAAPALFDLCEAKRSIGSLRGQRRGTERSEAGGRTWKPFSQLYEKGAVHSTPVILNGGKMDSKGKSSGS